MDPLSITVGAAIGGATGKFIEKLCDRGYKWLSEYFKDHYPKAQEAAADNSSDFVNELAQRVQSLEQSSEDIKTRIDSSLNDPSFSPLLKDALIASSQTNDREKHKILARIVSERLRCEPESLTALTSSLACRGVSSLTPKQIKFLGIATLVYGIRPSQFPPPSILPEQFGQWYINWLTQMLSVHMPLESIRSLDLTHLESLACLRYESFIGRDLKKVLSPKSETEYVWPFEEFVQDNPIGKKLKELWENQIQRVTLTTTGQLIGIYVNDELTKIPTTIQW